MTQQVCRWQDYDYNNFLIFVFKCPLPDLLVQNGGCCYPEQSMQRDISISAGLLAVPCHTNHEYAIMLLLTCFHSDRSKPLVTLVANYVSIVAAGTPLQRMQNIR